MFHVCAPVMIVDTLLVLSTKVLYLSEVTLNFSIHFNLNGSS